MSISGHGVQVVLVMMRAELGGDWENTAMLGGLIVYAALSKATPSAWLADITSRVNSHSSARWTHLCASPPHQREL